VAALVGICFQNPASQLSQVADTVFEEVAFGALNLGLDRLEVVRRTTAALEALDIAALAERDPRRLSGGQMQLVAVAGLLAMEPRHLVLDEPTAQLDPDGKQLVVDALRRLAANGTGLLIAEHDTDLLAGLCTRVVALEEGAIALSGATRDVLADERLIDLGVAPPADVGLRRELAAAGITIELPS
ncbi:MAG TPA: ABC transporter ATP-binding protein, partial [Candidatus Limnocylindrales bacterium]|nr:ABC transporter ATP-binding protein [Candidatus Limnocylindrales bacterium]